MKNCQDSLHGSVVVIVALHPEKTKVSGCAEPHTGIQPMQPMPTHYIAEQVVSLICIALHSLTFLSQAPHGDVLTMRWLCLCGFYYVFII